MSITSDLQNTQMAVPPAGTSPLAGNFGASLKDAVGSTAQMAGNTGMGMLKSVVGGGAQDAGLLQTMGQGIMNLPSRIASGAQKLFTGKSSINPTPFTTQSGYGMDFSPATQAAQPSNTQQQGASYALPLLNVATGGKELYENAPSLIHSLSGGKLLANENSAADVANIWARAYSSSDAGATAATDVPSTGKFSSGVADATPAYDSSTMKASSKITSPTGESIYRTTEGKGLTGNKTVNPSLYDVQNGQELDKIPDYPKNGTAFQKSQSADTAISKEAENMKSGLDAEDKANPLNANADKTQFSQLVGQHLPEDIQAKVGVNTPEENAMLKGMSEKAGSPIPKGGQYDLRAPGEKPSFPKTASGNYYKKVIDALNEYDGTRVGKLEFQQSIDSAYKDARGKLAFGDNEKNALDETHTDIRNAVKDDLIKSTNNTDVQASLQKQSRLFRARDVLDDKASQEGISRLKTLMKTHPETTRILRRALYTTAGVGTAGVLLRKQISNLFSGL